MLRLRRAIVRQGNTAIRGGTSLHLLRHDADAEKEIILPTPPQYRMASLRFLDIYKVSPPLSLSLSPCIICIHSHTLIFSSLSLYNVHLSEPFASLSSFCSWATKRHLPRSVLECMFILFTHFSFCDLELNPHFLTLFWVPFD